MNRAVVANLLQRLAGGALLRDGSFRIAAQSFLREGIRVGFHQDTRLELVLLPGSYETYDDIEWLRNTAASSLVTISKAPLVRLELEPVRLRSDRLDPDKAQAALAAAEREFGTE